VSKFLLISILVASIAVPARAARTKDPRAALKKAVVNVLIFNAIYWFFLMFLWGRV
jgi:hypothetical protein